MEYVFQRTNRKSCGWFPTSTGCLFQSARKPDWSSTWMVSHRPWTYPFSHSTGWILQVVKKIHGQDFFQFIMLLAGGMTAFHYQKVLSVVGKCISILRDPGAVSVSRKKSKWERKKFGRRKVKNTKSPWGQGFNRPVPNGRGNSGFWSVPENLCFFCSITEQQD